MKENPPTEPGEMRKKPTTLFQTRHKTLTSWKVILPVCSQFTVKFCEPKFGWTDLVECVSWL